MGGSQSTDAGSGGGSSGGGGGYESSGGNRWGYDKPALDNRANRLNPNHALTGPGRSAGYGGLGTPADLNNHSNQMNPNNSTYYSSRGGK